MTATNKQTAAAKTSSSVKKASRKTAPKSSTEKAKEALVIGIIGLVMMALTALVALVVKKITKSIERAGKVENPDSYEDVTKVTRHVETVSGVVDVEVDRDLAFRTALDTLERKAKDEAQARFDRAVAAAVKKASQGKKAEDDGDVVQAEFRGR